MRLTPPALRGSRRRARTGMTLIEIMVVMAVLVVIAAVAVPSLAGLLDLQQRAAAKELGQTMTWLVDEARLRNTSFRVAFNLDRNTWKVEVGDPDTLVYATPDEREEAEEKLKDEMKRFTKRELAEGAADELDEEDGPGRFEGLTDESFTTQQELPGGTRFLYVYTPQYGEDGMRGSEDGPSDDPEKDAWAYVYIFPDGTAEQAVIRIVDEDDPEDGWSVVMDPMTGKVSLDSDLVDPTESLAWLPEEGPEFR